MKSDKIRTCLLLAALVADTVFGFVGDWHSITYLDNVVCLVTYKGQIFTGTTGGIRQIQPQGLKERVFNNPAEGIRDIEIAGITTASGNSLWAVSRLGFIYHYNSSGSWRTFDRGFASVGWFVNPRAVASVGDYLLLGTEKGLSLFNRQSGKVAFNLHVFGRVQSVAVTALLVREPYLYIATSGGIFRAKIYWETPDNPPQEEYGDILNPQIWEEVDTTTSAGHLYWGPSGLAHLPSGTTIEEPFHVQVAPDRPIKVRDEMLGIFGMHAAAVAGERVFVGGTGGLFILDNGLPEPVRNLTSLPIGSPANVHSSPFGTYLWVLFANSAGVYRLNGNNWTRVPGFSLIQSLTPIQQKLNALNVTGENTFYLGNWGFGIRIFKDGVQDSIQAVNSCMTGIPTAPLFTVVRSTEPYKDKGLLSSIYHVSHPFSLAYLDYESGNVTCYPGTDLFDNATRARKLKFVEDSLLVVSTDKGIAVYTVRENGSRLAIRPLKKIDSPNTQDPEIIATEVDNYGRLWAADGTQIYYLDNFLSHGSGEDSLSSAPEFNTRECHYITRDPEGSLWFGCVNGLFHVTPGEKSAVEKIEKLDNRDGLLSENIVHMDLDSRNGHLWIVTDKGVNLYESSGRVALQKLDNALVYPNPFKSQHQFVVFDNLMPSSEVRIFSQSGSPVFRAGSDLVRGGQLRWYGDNQSGRPVKAGVYFYAIKSGNQWKKGKLIVAR